MVENYATTEIEEETSLFTCKPKLDITFKVRAKTQEVADDRALYVAEEIFSIGASLAAADRFTQIVEDDDPEVGV